MNLALFLFSYMGYSQIDSKLKVGVLIPQTGLLAEFGNEYSNGIKAALQEIQRSDPKLFSRISLHTSNNEGLTSKTEKMARSLYREERVDIVLGGLNYINSLAIAKVASENKKPSISPSAAYWNRKSENSYSFNMLPSQYHQGRMIAKFTINNLRKNKIFILHPKTQYGIYLAKGFYREAKSIGGNIVGIESFTEELKSLPDTFNKILLKKPDIVFLPAFYHDVLKITKLSSDKGAKITFIGSDGWDSPDLYSSSNPRMISGNYFFSQFSPKVRNPESIRFFTEYKSLFQMEPTAFAALGYETIHAVVNAFKSIKLLNGNNFKKALISSKFTDLLSGTNIRFDSSGNLLRSGVINATTQAGSVYYKTIQTP